MRLPGFFPTRIRSSEFDEIPVLHIPGLLVTVAGLGVGFNPPLTLIFQLFHVVPTVPLAFACLLRAQSEGFGSHPFVSRIISLLVSSLLLSSAWVRMGDFGSYVFVAPNF